MKSFFFPSRNMIIKWNRKGGDKAQNDTAQGHNINWLELIRSEMAEGWISSDLQPHYTTL